LFVDYKVEEINYNLGELTLTGLAFGNKNDELVLCLHGWLDNAASFLPMMPYLKDKRVIAMIGQVMVYHPIEVLMPIITL
jgi:hypothetical protein